jgi:hypothetical protein
MDFSEPQHCLWIQLRSSICWQFITYSWDAAFKLFNNRPSLWKELSFYSQWHMTYVHITKAICKQFFSAMNAYIKKILVENCSKVVKVGRNEIGFLIHILYSIMTTTRPLKKFLKIATNMIYQNNITWTIIRNRKTKPTIAPFHHINPGSRCGPCHRFHGVSVSPSWSRQIITIVPALSTLSTIIL